MGRKKRRVLKISLTIILFLIVGGTIANWYLKNKLENYLKSELSKEVYLATNGFYDMQFSDLSVGIIDGSLRIENIQFVPDTATFKEWAAKDSLPSTYFKIYVGSIHFEGINLTWRFNYKKLNFRLFEIQNPVVEIFDSQYSDRFEKKTKNTSDQTLHDLISPYIDVLTVKKMNMEHAHVVYSSFDGSSTSTYALKDVSFHAYGFRLDEDSFESGKLLYCDNFDFTTNRPQVLLSNNQFVFNTDKIELNTVDSIINIENVDLIPQKQLWIQNNELPESYVESRVKSIRLEGVYFNREDALNNLKARLFEVRDSEIKYFNLQKANKKDTLAENKQSKQRKEPAVLSWTLYAMVSPLFNSITIDEIGVNTARLQYTNRDKDTVDIYTLDNFNFAAYHFKVDPEADRKQRFLYSDGFSIDARGIQGNVNTKNQNIEVDELLLNTVLGRFQIAGVKLSPITTKTKYDYISGSIDSITVSGIQYEKGIKANLFSIDAPKIEYVKMPSRKSKSVDNPEDSAVDDPLQNLDVISPFFNHLSIDNVRINNANVRLRDKSVKGELNLYLPKVDFNATNLLINKETIENSGTYFTFDNFRLRFERFDNLLPGKEYRLKIKEGLLTGMKGRLYLRDVQLIPQENTWAKAPDTYIGFSSPFIDIRDINYDPFKKKQKITFGFFDLKAPRIRVVKTGDGKDDNRTKGSKSEEFDLLVFKTNVSDAAVSYIDKTLKDSVQVLSKNLYLDNLVWNSHLGISVNKLDILTPQVDIRKSGLQKTSVSRKSEKGKTAKLPLKINNIKVTDIGINLGQPDLEFGFATRQMLLEGIDRTGSVFRMDNLIIDAPAIKIAQTLRTPADSGSKSDNDADLYDQLRELAPLISIGNFNISEAAIDYKSALAGRTDVHQKLNTTTLKFKGLDVNAEKRDFKLDDFDFKTEDIHFPVDNGYYTMKIGDVELSKSKGLFRLDKIHLDAAFPKQEFAYYHPRNKDWFDVKVDNVTLSGIDFTTYFIEKELNASLLSVKNVNLLNYKNQKIEIEHNIMPFIYEGLYKVPVVFNIDSLDVTNFNVVYEELPKNGTEAGKIFFTEMNGRISDFTNKATSQNHHMTLLADGKLMGTGHFTAEWAIPADSAIDHFRLKAKLSDFNLQDLNQLITPLAPARVESGIVRDLTFSTDATSKGATVDMLFLYNNLHISVLKNQNGLLIENKLISRAANAVLKKDNPDIKRGKARKPRQIRSEIVRDPYHSTFNYFWQILQPPVVESVGVSQGKQNFMKKVAGFVGKVKNLFKRNKDKDKPEPEKE